MRRSLVFCTFTVLLSVAVAQNEPTFFATGNVTDSPSPVILTDSPSPAPTPSNGVLNGAGNDTLLGPEPSRTPPVTASPSPSPAATASPTPSSSSNSGNSSGSSSTQLASVDQLIPHFRGVVSCLPFNILVAAPQTPQGDNVRLSTNGRITITAEPAVINATAIAVEDGILTLSVRDGFFSKQPINFTVTAPPAGGELESISNSGTGMLVLGPGLNTSSLRVTAESVGQVRVLNATAETLIFSGAGVLDSSLSGAFNKVFVNTGAATGTVVVSSVTPVNMSVNLGGLTSLLVEAPEGSSILGQAAALAKVQYTNGSCSVSSQRASPTPSSSLLGSSGDIFGSKCNKVPAETVRLSLGAAHSPRWTCGVAVDGQLSCAGTNVVSREEIPLVPVFLSGGQAAVSGPTTLPDNTTSPNAPNNSFTANTSINAAGSGSTGTNAGLDSSPSSSTAVSESPIPIPANSVESPSPSSAGGNTVSSPSPSPAPPDGSNSAAAGGSSPASQSGGSNSGSDVSGTNIITGNSSGSPNAGLTGSATVEGFPAGQGTSPGGRRLLMPLLKSAAGRRLSQLFPNFPFPIIPVSTTGFTQGQGSSSFSSSSVTTPGGTIQQNTTSKNGDAPVTTGVYIPSRPLPSPSPAPSSSPTSPSPEGVASSQPNTTSSSPAPSPSPASSEPLASSISTGGQGGLSVINTQCAVNSSSLDMLLPPEEVQGPSPSPSPVASPSNTGNTSTGTSNTPTGEGTGSSPAVNAASPVINAGGGKDSAASPEPSTEPIGYNSKTTGNAGNNPANGGGSGTTNGAGSGGAGSGTGGNAGNTLVIAPGASGGNNTVGSGSTNGGGNNTVGSASTNGGGNNTVGSASTNGGGTGA